MHRAILADIEHNVRTSPRNDGTCWGSDGITRTFNLKSNLERARGRVYTSINCGRIGESVTVIPDGKCGNDIASLRSCEGLGGRGGWHANSAGVRPVGGSVHTILTISGTKRSPEALQKFRVRLAQVGGRHAHRRLRVRLRADAIIPLCHSLALEVASLEIGLSNSRSEWDLTES